MKKLLFILFLLFTLTGKSQTYAPMVVDSAVWIIQGDDYSATPWIDTYYGYYMNGDTTDGSQTYKKVYKLYFTDEAPIWTLPYQLDSMVLFALVRESSKMVYAKQFYPGNPCALNSEFLLYDFNFVVGDTASNLCIYYDPFATITSIGINSTYSRKCFNIGSSHQFIEGIGSNFGLFETIFTNVSGGMYLTLYDYCQGHIPDCNVITGIYSEKEAAGKFEIYPSPFTNELSISGNDHFVDITIQMYDVLGKEVFSVVSSFDQKTKIAVPDLRPGIYLIHLKNESGSVYSKKLIKTN